MKCSFVWTLTCLLIVLKLELKKTTAFLCLYSKTTLLILIVYYKTTLLILITFNKTTCNCLSPQCVGPNHGSCITRNCHSDEVLAYDKVEKQSWCSTDCSPNHLPQMCMADWNRWDSDSVYHHPTVVILVQSQAVLIKVTKRISPRVAFWKLYICKMH